MQKAGFFVANKALCPIGYRRYVAGMSLLEELRSKIAKNEFEFSQHAVDQSILRRVSVEELK